ncbi:prephenate dehydrogenase/arogenate dehydrogenase family protein [candidate division KSB1 bacterium]|nr:prephenate dehydrogenase/arogenate dehydrogenase family protein [candidate division KSB1 bacterium]
MLKETFQRIAVVGLGLIGGSLVKSLRRAVPDCKLAGVDFHEVLVQAQDDLDAAFLPENLAEALHDADLVFLATPVGVILRLLPEVAKTVRPGTIVTDVGSTKSWIVEQAAQYFNGERCFIGGHPMAGGEKGGWENAEAHLFENAAYVLTPAPNPPAHSLESLANLLQALGARIIILDPEEHDRLVAEVSHLPQLLAIALTNFIARHGEEEHEPRLQLAAGGFRDMTRIAASSFSIWQDILNSNRANIRQSLQEFIAVLQQLARDLNNDNLEAGFRRANQLRQLIAPP